MTNIVEVNYEQTGQSVQPNMYGMREMQALAFAKRESQYLLIKSPPASGKSRALMFLALDKLKNQGIRKVIVTVPEVTIGSSFKDTELKQHGFFADWTVIPKNNLCFGKEEKQKTDAFVRFMLGDDEIVICTHTTLRNSFNKLPTETFNNCLVAIDEFHHVSSSDKNQLGKVIDALMHETTAHIVAMSGSYFRGDAIPIMPPEDEALFTKVTYTYYQQLNGYRYLKSLGLGYHFYQRDWKEILESVLDVTKKTIVYIPNVNSAPSTGDKHGETNTIIDCIGELQDIDSEHHIYYVKRKTDGKVIKVANLVNNKTKIRRSVDAYLSRIQSADDMDIIIALGKAKEGFDWPYCEHLITIGYRGSMTEILQIIGRATRDCPGKTHAQFTYLIQEPGAPKVDVQVSVNNMLKAILVALLMEQVLAPNIHFQPRSRWNGEALPSNRILIDDIDRPMSNRAMTILNEGSEEIITALVNNPKVVNSITDITAGPAISRYALPSAIEKLHPELTELEVEQVSENILRKLFIRNNGGIIKRKDLPPDVIIEKKDEKESTEDKFIKMNDKFINIDDLPIDLIDTVNPFYESYEILSKTITPGILKTVQDITRVGRTVITEAEALMMHPKIKAFKREHGRMPSPHSSNDVERYYAEVAAFIQNEIRKLKQQGE